jgi:hypothetical protein
MPDSSICAPGVCLTALTRATAFSLGIAAPTSYKAPSQPLASIERATPAIGTPLRGCAPRIEITSVVVGKNASSFDARRDARKAHAAQNPS